ncbi:MAG TPA: hypothetical protein VHO91_13880 [Rhodopila sp.]|nr:hypothetical protein [Rhodopila sp.]
MSGGVRLIVLAGLAAGLAGCDARPRASIDQWDWVRVYNHYVTLPANKALVLDTESGERYTASGARTALDAVAQAIDACKRATSNDLSRCMPIYMDGLTVGDISQFIVIPPVDIGGT